MKVQMLTGWTLLLWICFASPLWAGPPILQTFTLTEQFGVSHPEQIIDFDLNKEVVANNAYMIGPDGLEVPYQILEGGKKIAVRTDLPKGERKQWSLMSGHAPQPVVAGIQVEEETEAYVITNGLTGVRIPKPVTEAGDRWRPLFDFNGWKPDAPRVFVPAPLQGVLYRDGTWSGLGPNGMVALASTFDGMEVQFKERGPLKAVVTVVYRFSRPAIKDGNRGVWADGTVRYVSTIEIQAGQPSILFEEESDTDISYSLNLYTGLHPTNARYQGHHATTPEYGHEQDGQVYRMWHTRPNNPNLDAQVDLLFEKLMRSDRSRTSDSWRRMAIWEPWIFDSGWYWQLYDAKATDSANLLGIFAGRASRALGAASSGTGLFTLPPTQADGEPGAGLTIALYGRQPGSTLFPLSRYAWGLFLGVKGQDLAAPDSVQPIARQMNLHAGINLNKLHRLQFDYPDPSGGYGSLYMDAAVVRRMIARVRQEPDYQKFLLRTSPGSTDLVNLWADATGVKARKGVEDLVAKSARLLDIMVNGNGIYDFGTHYWMGGSQMLKNLLDADQLLATGQLTKQEAVRVKSQMVLNAAILLDDDHTPLSAAHGCNLGNPNMQIQQRGMRHQAVLLLAQHPMMRELIPQVWKEAQEELHTSINQFGSHMSAIGYISTSQPVLGVLLGLQNRGVVDAFREEDRLTKFAEFYLNTLTPPEPRFGNLRKSIAVGDSSTAGSPIMGYLGTGFARSNPVLSKRLMGGWRAMGFPHHDYYGPTLLQINQELPDTPPSLTDAAFPGYYSVLRYAWDRPYESAVWCINGNFYADHVHNDVGSLIYYALGAPIIVDWGGGYYPQTKAGMMHSTIIEESAFGHPWDQGDAGETNDLNRGGAGLSQHYGGTHAEAEQEGLLSFLAASRLISRFESNGLVWRRTVTQLHPNEAYPVLVIADRFSGKAQEQPKIFSLNLMADGPVATPAGQMLPPQRSYANPLDKNGGESRQLPSAGDLFTLSPGLNRLSFVGQNWPKHPTQGIDWDLYLVAEEEQQAQIGNWGHFWHPGPEQQQFKQANSRPFEERQDILRVRGMGPFTALILPFRKGKGRTDMRVIREGKTISIAAGDETTRLGENFYAYQKSKLCILASFSEQSVSEMGIQIAGGPAEVILTPGLASIRLHGTPGTRRLSLPGNWRINMGHSLPIPVSSEGGRLTLVYGGGEPVTITLPQKH